MKLPHTAAAAAAAAFFFALTRYNQIKLGEGN
jgi:hypothetical protein